MLLSHLPEELLEMILEELLPPMDKGQPDICPNDVLKCLPVPRDLCTLMVVCKLFRRLAEPFVWRRAAIVLHDPNAPDANSEDDLDCFQGPLVFQWPYLRDNPQLASHIRILTLEILGYKRDTSSFSSLRTLKSVVSHMSNLRVLRLYIYSKHRKTEEIYMSLVNKPLLHTVITLYQVPPEVQMPLRSTLTHLNILEWNPAYASLLRVAPCLQSLTITGADGEARFGVMSLDTIPIPWGTLRKIALKWVKNWNLVLTNLSSWKNSHPNTPSPLSEFTLQLFGPQMTAENVEQVSCIGQDLRALYLCGPSVVDKRALHTILNAFPKLEDLGLLTDYWCKPWNVNLPTLLHSLERLPRLKRLHWNYVDQDVAQNTDSDEAMFALKVMSQRIVPIVALRCKALERITFNDEPESSIENFFHSYSISRDRDGEYNGHVDESVLLTNMSLDKTSWDFWDYEHV